MPLPTGALITVLFNLAAKYLEKHGEEYFERVMTILWAKISPNTAPKVFEASGDPVVAQFAADCDAEIARAA